ncbi:MAG: hypothetical protein IAG13_04580 [Deltaproteobacteria bacterium]|nr:hypothetical protein [Nannocystaceae bacterium]
MRPGPLMVEHEIGPAIRVEAGPAAAASVVFPQLHAAGRTIEGWFAIDDPEVRLLRGDVVVVISTRSAGASWREAARLAVKRRAGRQPIDVRLPDDEVVDLRVEVRASAALPRAGFELDIETAPP